MSFLPWVMAGVGALSSLQKSSQAAAVADYNARVAENNAISERAFAEADAARAREAGARQRAKLRAAAGASGVDTGTGSILDVLSDDAVEAELDALNIKAQGESRAVAHEAQATRYKMEAKNTRSSAFLSAIGAGLSGYSAGSSIGKVGGTKK